MKTRHTEAGPLPPLAALAMKQGRKIDAIKIVREREGLGLKEAKERVERYVESDPALKYELDQRAAETRRAIIRWALIIDVIVVAAVLWWFFGPD